MKKSIRAKGNTSVQLKGTKSTRNRILETCLVLKKIKRNGVKGGVPTGQDPSQLILQFVRRKGLKECLIPKEQRQIKAYANTIQEGSRFQV